MLIVGRPRWIVISDPGRDEPRRRTTGLLVFLVSFFWLAFWLYGQPFFDDDYGRWLRPARELSWSTILFRVAAPIPPDWGFLDRPVILGFFKAGSELFGAHAAPYFWMKSAIAASLCLLLYRMSARYAIGPALAPTRYRGWIVHVPWVLFLTAEHVWKSMVWLCDLEVLSQLSVLAALLLYLEYRRRGLHRGGWTRTSVVWQLAIFAVAFIGFKTKSSAKIVPGVILLHSLWMDRGSARHFLPLVAAMVATCVPWLGLARQPVPEFLLGSDLARETPSFFWRRASLTGFRDLFLGDLRSWWPFATGKVRPFGAVQILAPFGLAALALGLFGGRRARTSEPDEMGMTAFLLIWLSLSTALLSIYPRIPPAFLNRYLVAIWIPVVLVLGRVVALGLRERSTAVIAGAVAACLALQVATGIQQTRMAKTQIGVHLMITDHVRATLEAEYRDTTFIYIAEQNHAYWAPVGGNRYHVLMQLNESKLLGIQAEARAGRSVYRIIPLSDVLPPWRREREIRLGVGAYGRLLGIDERRLIRYVDRWVVGADTVLDR
jgi:hypothetical protein